MNGGVRLYITKQHMHEWWCETLHQMTKRSGDEGKPCLCRSHWNGCMIVVIWCCHAERCRFATRCCETHRNGCMNVAWPLFLGGSRSTKPGVFPCKVAAAGDERYLVCVAGAAAVVRPANWFLLCVLQRVVVPVCVVLCVS